VKDGVISCVRATVAVHATRARGLSEEVQVELETTVYSKRLHHMVCPRDHGGSPVNPPSDIWDESWRPRGVVRRCPFPLPLRDGSLSLEFFDLGSGQGRIVWDGVL